MHLQQKSAGSQIVGLSNNFSMGWYWSGIKKVSDVKTFGLSNILSTFLAYFILKSRVV